MAEDKNGLVYLSLLAVVAVVGLVALQSGSFGGMGGTTVVAEPVVMDEDGNVLAQGVEAENLVGDARAMSRTEFYVLKDNREAQVSKSVALKTLKSGGYVKMVGLSDTVFNRVMKRYGFSVEADGIYNKDGVQVANQQGEFVQTAVIAQQRAAAAIAAEASQQVAALDRAALAASGLDQQIQGGNTAQLNPGDTKTATLNPQDGNTAQFNPGDANTASLNPQDGNAAQFNPGDTNTASLNPQDGNTATLNPQDGNTATLNPQGGIQAFDAGGNSVSCLSQDGSTGVLVNSEGVKVTLNSRGIATPTATAQGSSTASCTNPRTAHGDRACVYGRHAYGHGTGWWTATCMRGQWTINGGACRTVTEPTNSATAQWNSTNSSQNNQSNATVMACSSPSGASGSYACIRGYTYICKGSSWVANGGVCSQ